MPAAPTFPATSARASSHRPRGPHFGTFVRKVAAKLSTGFPLHILPLSEVGAREVERSQPRPRADWRFLSHSAQLRAGSDPGDITAAARPSQAIPHPDELAPITVAELCNALAPASWRRDETAAGHACELCRVVYAPTGPVSVATVLQHLEFDCPRSPIGRRLGRLAPAQFIGAEGETLISESEARALDGDR